MDKRIHLNKLYDYYGELFTFKQRECFEDYYFRNLSLSEIAENNNISRNAVHNQLKIVEEKLEDFEKTLKLFCKHEKILEILNGNVSNDIIIKIQELI